MSTYSDKNLHRCYMCGIWTYARTICDVCFDTFGHQLGIAPAQTIDKTLDTLDRLTPVVRGAAVRKPGRSQGQLAPLYLDKTEIYTHPVDNQ